MLPRRHFTRLVPALLVALPLIGRAASAQSAAPPGSSATTASPAGVLPLTLFGEVRTRSELEHPSGQTGDAFTYLRSRLGLRVDPAPGAQIVLQVQDSRVFGTEGSSVAPAAAIDQLELHQGYLQVGHPWGQVSLTLRAGRQE